jgi:Holliday junction resolvase
VSTKSKAKGTTAEREVVRYLQNWWPAAERRALSGNKDKGDVAGIPGVVVEVKAAQRLELAAWKRETETEAQNAGVTARLLVVKRARKPVAEWDVYMPRDMFDGLPLREAKEWVRMDLQLAAAILCSYLLYRSSPTTA